MTGIVRSSIAFKYVPNGFPVLPIPAHSELSTTQKVALIGASLLVAGFVIHSLLPYGIEILGRTTIGYSFKTYL